MKRRWRRKRRGRGEWSVWRRWVGSGSSWRALGKDLSLALNLCFHLNSLAFLALEVDLS